MAVRDISTIQAAIVADLVARAATVGVVITPSEWSDYDYRQLLTYVDAAANGITEQLWAAFMEDVLALIAAAAPQTGPWFQAQMLKFQFDGTTPQILQFDYAEGIDSTFAPFYETVNTLKRVIKYCSVVPGIFGTTVIKVAAQVGGFPADLDTEFPGALASAQSTALLLSVPGIAVNVQSGNSDKIYVAATIYYQGAYSAVIATTVIDAIQGYLRNIPFNGVVLLSNIELAIKAVTGVNDVVFSNVQARADSTAYGSGTNLVLSSTVVARRWATVAGYIVGETDSGHTLADSLTFTAE